MNLFALGKSPTWDLEQEHSVKSQLLSTWDLIMGACMSLPTIAWNTWSLASIRGVLEKLKEKKINGILSYRIHCMPPDSLSLNLNKTHS
jgi:hypothetical protein